MKHMDFTKVRLGILGGGQLGKMLVSAASQWQIKTYILDPNLDGPASEICSRFVLGDFTDYESVYDFGQRVDMLTIEIENVNVEALEDLQKEGKMVYPDPKVIKIIQDKGLQKQFFKEHGIPTTGFEIFKNKKEVLEAVRSGRLKSPFVQKLRTSGYDGRGVLVFDSNSNTSELLEDECIVEDFSDLKKEIAVIVARNKQGEMVHFTPVEMQFNPEANLVEYLLSPAEISEEISSRAIELARKTTDAFDLVGVMAVEMFLDKNDQILVNEVAPRPHNSGHHTIENCYTSQYEQMIRALYNFPFGSTKMIIPAVMVNILGEAGNKGPAKYHGLDEVLAMEGVNVYIYGKPNTRPFRKMGHITVIDEDPKAAIAKARQIKNLLKVIS